MHFRVPKTLNFQGPKASPELVLFGFASLIQTLQTDFSILGAPSRIKAAEPISYICTVGDIRWKIYYKIEHSSI